MHVLPSFPRGWGPPKKQRSYNWKTLHSVFSSDGPFQGLFLKLLFKSSSKIRFSDSFFILLAICMQCVCQLVFKFACPMLLNA